MTRKASFIYGMKKGVGTDNAMLRVCYQKGKLKSAGDFNTLRNNKKWKIKYYGKYIAILPLVLIQLSFIPWDGLLTNGILDQSLTFRSVRFRAHFFVSRVQQIDQRSLQVLSLTKSA